MKDASPNMVHGDSEADDVTAPIEKAVQEIVDLVPEEKREQALTRIVKVVSTIEEFRGIMPHPQHAQQYEAICPGAFDRMLAMREKELDYSIERDRTDLANNAEWERRDQENANSHTRLAMWLGFGLGVCLIAGAVVCGAIGQPALGGGLVAASAASMVPAFLNGRREKGSRREDGKSPDSDAPDPASPPPRASRPPAQPPQQPADKAAQKQKGARARSR